MAIGYTGGNAMVTARSGRLREHAMLDSPDRCNQRSARRITVVRGVARTTPRKHAFVSRALEYGTREPPMLKNRTTLDRDGE